MAYQFRLGRPDGPNGPLFAQPLMAADGSPRPLLHRCHACGSTYRRTPRFCGDCGECDGRGTVNPVVHPRAFLIMSIN